MLAIEAKRIAEQEKRGGQLRELGKLIEEAARRGHFSIDVEDDIHMDDCEALKLAGYEFDEVQRDGKWITVISWRNPR